MRLLLAAPLLVAGAALAGPYDQPYAIVATDTARSADPNVLPVIVNRVDGRNADSGNRAVVAPGARQVTVDLPARKGFHRATQETLALDAKPCVRYNVSARLASPTTQDWKPFVRSGERIVECEAKFKVAGK